MAETTEGQTESPTKTVEPQGDLTEFDLSGILKEALEREEQPEPQPDVAEEQSEESEPSEEASVSAEEETDTDLSQTETTDAEAEQAAEEVDGDEDGLNADVQASVDKRIGKEVRKRKEALEAKEAAESKVTELKAQLEQAESAVDAANDFAAPKTEANPYADLNTLEEVETQMMRAEQMMEWAEDNPDGALVETKEGQQEYTAEEVREIKKRASRALRRQLPEQQGYIQSRDHLEPVVLDAYPWWKDKASSEFQSASQVLRNMPELARFPDYKLVVGDYLNGMVNRMNRDTQKVQPKAKEVKKAPSQPTAPSAEPAPVDPTAARSASALKSFQETGGVDELANLLKTGDI
jgi:hypothetical protein